MLLHLVKWEGFEILSARSEQENMGGQTASEQFLAVRWLKAFKNQTCLKSPLNLFSVTGTQHPSVPPDLQ